MSINTIVEQLKNLAAPEVKVEREIELNDQIHDEAAFLDKLSEAFQLRFREKRNNTYRFKYPGSGIVDPCQLKVIWGATPDEAPYHDLQAFVDLSLSAGNILRIKLFENMMGTRSEQVVFQRVLAERMEVMVDYLKNTLHWKEVQ